MKILYRPYRGGLNESLREVEEFTSLKDMLQYIVSHSKGAFLIQDIYISHYAYDNRIEWDTYAVCVGKYFDCDYLKTYNHPQIIGFCTFIGSN